MKEKYQVDWFVFENRIRRVNRDVLEPVCARQEQLQKLIDREVFRKIDSIQKRQDSDAQEIDRAKEAGVGAVLLGAEVKELRTKQEDYERF